MDMRATDVNEDSAVSATAAPASETSTVDCEPMEQNIDPKLEPIPAKEQNDSLFDAATPDAPRLNGCALEELFQPEHAAISAEVPPHANGYAARPEAANAVGISTPASKNGPVEAADAFNSPDASAAPPDPATKPKRGKPKKKNKNYAIIHSKPLPLDVHPLPAFHPTNPISLLKLCYCWLSQILSPPSSHPPSRYQGYFSLETRSVHVTNPAHIRALWEMGFFGKGALSRSEPSWLDRAKAKAQELRSGGTAEEATNARREERRLFKLERARLEREKIERQRAVEEGRMTAEEAAAIEAALEEKDERESRKPEQNGKAPASDGTQVPNGIPPAPRVVRHVNAAPTDDLQPEEPDIANEEHLQLTLEEAFFLSYGLGVLDISTLDSSTSSSDLLGLFAAHATFPPSSHLTSIPPDNPFLLNYVVYHHFRSLGWVVRSGLKFSCDYLLYQRGPVFSHAEFALLIIPSYSDAYWKTKSGMKERRCKEKDWWWLHCVNRVQSQVKKTLVLVYVDVPAPREPGEDVGALLRGYKVREFVLRRWIANRSRD